jgi:hypothetical protein
MFLSYIFCASVATFIFAAEKPNVTERDKDYSACGKYEGENQESPIAGNRSFVQVFSVHR